MISFADSPKLMTALAAVTVVLAAANLRSLRQRALTDTVVAPPPRTPRPPPPVNPPEPPAKVIPAAQAPIPAMSFDPGLEVDALLDPSVELLCGDTRTVHVPFRQALPRGELRVVNLWNVNCPPCIAEFPQLATLLASAPKLAKFVALDTHESADPHISYRDSRAKHMPTSDARLAERLAFPIFDEALRIAQQQLHREGGLPITFVIDCRHRLRWLKTGKLDHHEAAELTQLLTRLADDGCTSAPRISVTESVCNPPPPPPPPPLKEIKSRKDCARCKTGLCKETWRGRLVCDDSDLFK